MIAHHDNRSAPVGLGNPGTEPLVEVIPLGQVPPLAAKVIAGHLQAIFDLPARILPARPEPDFALLATRGQYDAGRILLDLARDHIHGHNQTRPPLCLGLMNRDLCLPFLSYVFGQAQLEGRSALVSLHRLREPGRNDKETSSLFLERAAKVALHEIAHVLGLVHCDATQCLLNFSAGLDHLDRLKLILCPHCRELLLIQRQQLIARAE